MLQATTGIFNTTQWVDEDAARVVFSNVMIQE